MPAVTAPAHQKGDFLVDYEEKVFEDVKAEPGEKALVTFHTVAFEGSIGLVNMLQALRLQRKGFETAVLLYGPGVTLGVQRGFPKLGDEAFPGHQNFNNQLTKFMGEGGKVYACRFALQALYGHGEPSLIPGIRPINPLDVLDLILLHRKDNAFISEVPNKQASSPGHEHEVLRGIRGNVHPPVRVRPGPVPDQLQDIHVAVRPRMTARSAAVQHDCQRQPPQRALRFFRCVFTSTPRLPGDRGWLPRVVTHTTTLTVFASHWLTARPGHADGTVTFA